jgi:hypothetical protein
MVRVGAEWFIRVQVCGERKRGNVETGAPRAHPLFSHTAPRGLWPGGDGLGILVDNAVNQAAEAAGIWFQQFNGGWKNVHPFVPDACG